MKLLLTVLKRVHKPAVYCSRQLCQALIVGSSRELVQSLGAQVEVRAAFITEEEEGALLLELEPGLKKKRYEFDHWDDVSNEKLFTMNVGQLEMSTESVFCDL